MLAPSLVILGVFVIYPLGQADLARPQRCDAQGENCRSNGWDQYVDVARSDEFQHALLGDRQVRPAHGAARAGARRRAGRARRQVPARHRPSSAFIFSSTIATSVAVASLMWLFLLAARRSARWPTSAGSATCSRSSSRRACCATPGTALTSVAASSVWASLGFTFILVTAGLQGIPRDLHEAAAIDGAGGIRRFWSDHAADARPDAAVRRHRADDPGLPGLRRDRPAHRRRAAAGGLDDHDHLPDLRHRLDHQQQRRAAGGASPCCCSCVLLVLSLLQLAGIGTRVHYA